MTVIGNAREAWCKSPVNQSWISVVQFDQTRFQFLVARGGAKKEGGDRALPIKFGLR